MREEAGQGDEQGGGTGPHGSPRRIQKDWEEGHGPNNPFIQHSSKAGRGPWHEERPAPPGCRKTICDDNRERGQGTDTVSAPQGCRTS